MSGRFLDDAARSAFAKAIKAIEDVSAIEVVVAVRRKSAGYRLVNAGVGVAVAFVALATMVFSEHPFGDLSILADPFVVGAIAAWLVELTPGLKRLATPTAIRDRQVRAAARATFVERGVHNTRDRSGILIYVSWLEQRVVVVPDSGLGRVLPAPAVERIEAELTAAMRGGGAAVARVLETAMVKVAPGMPRRADDVNELPDAIDSDMPGQRHGRGQK